MEMTGYPLVVTHYCDKLSASKLIESLIVQHFRSPKALPPEHAILLRIFYVFMLDFYIMIPYAENVFG